MRNLRGEDCALIVPEGYILAPIEPTPEMRFALSRAAGVTPGDVWGQGAEGEWVWLNGILAALGGNEEEIQEQRALEEGFASRHPKDKISGSTADSESGRRLRAEIGRKARYAVADNGVQLPQDVQAPVGRLETQLKLAAEAWAEWKTCLSIEERDAAYTKLDVALAHPSPVPMEAKPLEGGLRASAQARRIAQIIYDEMEEPVANQDASRQRRQWTMCVKIALAIEVELLLRSTRP